MEIKTKLDSQAVMQKRRGLNPLGKVQKQLTSEVARHLDGYVPMQSGRLKNDKTVRVDSITYRAPYAHYHYIGLLRIGKAPKQLTDRPMKYHGAPRRGPYWDKRMWQDKRATIMRTVAKLAGGTGK